MTKILLLLAVCAATVTPAWAQELKPACPDAASKMIVENGSYSSQPGVTFLLRHFHATLVPQSKTLPDCLTKMTDVSHADIFVSSESLTQVFSKKLGATESHIRNLKITHDFTGVTLTGEITKLVPIKFSITGPVSTDGSILSLHAQKINADGIPMKMLLSMVGEHLSSMMSFKGVNGVVVDGDVMSFSPEKFAHLRGYIASVETTPKGLTLHYGRKPPALATRPAAAKAG